MLEKSEYERGGGVPRVSYANEEKTPEQRVDNDIEDTVLCV